MRCPGPPCHLGPHCWRDSVGKKHYKQKTHHFRRLIRYAEQGHSIRAHDDVPEDIRDELYAEEHQRLERRQAASAKYQPGMNPINITNVLPGNSPQGSLPASNAARRLRCLQSPCRLTSLRYLASEILLYRNTASGSSQGSATKC